MSKAAPRIVGVELGEGAPGALSIRFEFETSGPTILYEGPESAAKRFLEWFFADETRKRLLVDALRAGGMTSAELAAWAGIDEADCE